MPEQATELMPAIEAALKEAEKPLDCNQLYAMEHIQAIAPSVNRVSDYLSVLFRKGLVVRVAAERDPVTGTRTRWAYLWREQNPLKVEHWQQQNDKRVQVHRPKSLVDKPNLYISEHGDFIDIQLPGFSITIQKTK